MKRKAVVRLLAGTLCTATMAGSILPDVAVAYAMENPVETVETAPQEETSDTVLAADKKNEAETPENTADPVDSAQEKEDPTAIDMEAKESEASKNKKEDGKTGQTDSGDQEKQPVQESGGAANDFKVEKKTKKKSENSTDKKKTEKGNDSRTEQNEEKPPVEEVFDEGYAASCKTYNDILTNLSFAEDSTVQDTAKFFVDECKEDLKKLAEPKRNLSAFLDGSYEAAIRAEEGEDGSQDSENVRPTELITQYEESKPQLEEVIACLNTFVTTDHETPEEKEAALQAAYETLDAYLNASNACRPQVSLETQENVSVPLAAEKTVTENGVRAFGWKYDDSYTSKTVTSMSDIQKYAKSGKKYILKLNKNINISKQINVMNNTKLVIVSTGSDKFSLKVNNMSKDPNTYSDMFRVEKGSSLTLGDNEKNGKHGVILDGRGTAHMGRLVCVEVGGSLNIYPGTEIKNNNSMDGRGSGIINKGTMMMYGGTISGNKFATTEKNFQEVNLKDDDDKTYCHGGGLRNDGNCTIKDGTISGNTAATGGGIYTTGPDYESDQKEAVLKITKCKIENNKALGTDRGTGGGIVVGSYMGSYYDKTLKKNVPYVKNGGTLIIDGGGNNEVHISGNTAGNESFGIAGGIMNNGYADIKNCIIENNQASSKGAIKNGSYDHTKPDIIYNGKSHHEGTMNLDSVSIRNNVARETGADGTPSSSAVGSHGNMTIKNSNIHDNTSKGLANCGTETGQPVTLTVQDTEICRNKSDGIHAYGEKSGAVIDGCNVHDNSGHGIRNSRTLTFSGGTTKSEQNGTANKFYYGLKNNAGGDIKIRTGLNITKSASNGISNAGSVTLAAGNTLTVKENSIGISNTGTFKADGTLDVEKNTGTAVKNSENGTFDLNSNSTIVNTMADGTAIINEGKGVFTVKRKTKPTISGAGKGISNSATFHHNGNGTVTGNKDYSIYNTASGVFNVTAGVKVTGSEKGGISNNGTVNVATGAAPTIEGKKGITNNGTVNYKGNGTVTGSNSSETEESYGIQNKADGKLYISGPVKIASIKSNGINNQGTSVISGTASINSEEQAALNNGINGTCTISGKATFQSVKEKSIYNKGRLINTSAATYQSVDSRSVLQNGTFEISSDASHSKNLCIYLYEQKFVTVTGALNSVNYLQPKNRKAGRKVAQASYAGADGSTILNKLALTDDSRFCLRSGKTVNLQKANAALKGSGINASDLTAKDVILSEAVHVTYKSGLNADIACTMPETQDTYWYEDVKVKASVNVNGKESMKPYIQDKAQRNIYQFLGWYDGDSVQRYDPVTDQWYDPETRKWSKDYTYSGAKDLVLTARWEKSYNIAYHGNGQTVGDDYTQEKDKSLIISDTEMYKFDGKFYKGLVGEDTFQRTETYKKDENGNLLNENNKTVTDERRATKLTSLNPDTGKEEPCEEQYSVKEWGTSAVVRKDESKSFRLNKEYATGKVYDTALQSTNDKGENLCITYDAPDDMVKKGREEKPADKLTLGVKKQDAAIYGASQGKMTSGTWLNMYAVWDKFPQLDAYNRYFTLKQAENGEITTEALLTTLRFKDEEDTDGKYLYSKDYEYNKKENCLIIKGKDGATLKLRAETDMESLKETGKSTIRYTLTDSAGNITTKKVECRIVDTSDIPKEYDTYVRFISPKYYKKNGAYVSKENGGLEENSIWKTDPEYAALLDKAMSNEKRGIQKKSVRVFGVKFEADDPGSGTWDHVEETWEFTHEQVRSVDDFVDQHGYMNYKEKDGLKKFREQYKDCIK